MASSLNSFINHCESVEYISNGIDGITFKVTSSVFYSRMSSKTILMKLVCLNNNINSTNHRKDVIFGSVNMTLRETNEDVFRNECIIQDVIYKKSSHNGDALCPRALYYGLMDPLWLEKLIEKTEIKYSYFFEELIDMIKTDELSIGILCMEFLENYVSMFSMVDRKNHNEDKYIHMARQLIIELAVRTGYTQGDFHLKNIMFNEMDDSFYRGIAGRPIFIDFGNATKINNEDMKDIMKFYEDKNYFEIIKIICSQKRPNAMTPYNWGRKKYIFFNYVCIPPSQLTSTKINMLNQSIDSLFQKRELVHKSRQQRRNNNRTKSAKSIKSPKSIKSIRSIRTLKNIHTN